MDDANSYYGDFITNFDEICRKSIVRIRSWAINDRNKKVSRSGVVIASTERSCFIITSSGIYKGNEVEFHDGTKKQSDPKFVKTSKNFKLAVIPIFDLGNGHWQTANFSGNEVIPNQKVFTCGFNLDRTTNFISGSLVSGVRVRNEDSPWETAFVHSCSAGLNGYKGSAVFNETKELVGVNFFYTKSQGVDYVPSKPYSHGASASGSSSSGGIASEFKSVSHSYGGLVSALDLRTIRCGLADIYPATKRMSLQGALQYLRNALRSRELQMSMQDAREG